jgi:hypothetical protein
MTISGDASRRAASSARALQKEERVVFPLARALGGLVDPTKTSRRTALTPSGQ